MSKMKKLLAAIMAVLMLVGLAACGEDKGPANSTTAPKATDMTTDKATDMAAEPPATRGLSVWDALLLFCC